MSRRSRRKKGAGKSPWLGKLLIVMGGLLILAAGFGYFGLRSYLHSEGFRKFLSAEVSRLTKMEGSFDPFKWDGLAVETPGFRASGSGVMASVEADGIDTEVGFGGVGRGVWEIKATRISRLGIGLDLKKKDEPPPTAPAAHKEQVMRKQPGWVPQEVEIESLEIGDIAVRAKMESGEVIAKGLSLSATPDTGKNTFKGEIGGGTIATPFGFVPELRVKRIVGAYRDGSAFITEAELGAWENGRIQSFGEWDSRSGRYSFEGDLQGVKCAELLSENWARRLTGDVSSTFSIDNLRGSMAMAGELRVLNGTLTALPMLDSLAAYADTRRFRILQLNEARTKWRWTEDEILLTDIAMGSEGLIRIEGSLSIRGNAIDGRFRLGLVPGTLSAIPGAENKVFLPGTHGLLWAPLHVTGTLEDPQEDLTGRLIEAAGMRMFEKLPETGETVLRFTKKAIGEDPGGAIGKGLELLEKSGTAIDKGRDIIRQGEDVIDAAGGVLDGVIGSGFLLPKLPRENPQDIPIPQGE
ncbi:hypothetical protein HZ994_01345 [Akkermansiaceae bacterium]|nr:hypothetical protein HZ994_01345 [Akkermansiaceae bacterium]